MDAKSKSPIRQRGGDSMEPSLSRGEKIKTKGATPVTSRSAKKKKRKKKRRDSERENAGDDTKETSVGHNSGVDESKVSSDSVKHNALESQLKGLDTTALEDLMRSANTTTSKETKLNLDEETSTGDRSLTETDAKGDAGDIKEEKDDSGMGFTPSSPASLSVKIDSASVEIDDDDELHLAATKLQSRIRMHNSRRTFMKEKHVRVEKERKAQESQRRSSIAIQSLFRGKRARELKAQLLLQQAAAAFNTEYRASSIISRTILKWLIGLREKKREAALVLQKCYKNKKERDAKKEVIEPAPAPAPAPSKKQSKHIHDNESDAEARKREEKERECMCAMELESIAIDRASCRHYIYSLETTLNTMNTSNAQVTATISHQQQQQRREAVLKSLAWEEEAQRRMAQQKDQYEISLSEIDLILRNKVQSFTKVKEANEALILHLQSEVTEMKEENMSLHTQLAQEREERRKDVEEMQHLQSEVEGMRIDHKQALSHQQQQYEASISDLKESHNQHLSDMKEKEEAHLKNLSALHSKDLLETTGVRDSVHEEMVRDKDALMDELQAQLATMREMLETNQKNHKAAYDLLLTRYEEESSNWTEVYTEKQSELANLESELLQAYESLESAQASVRVANLRHRKMEARISRDGNLSNDSSPGSAGGNNDTDLIEKEGSDEGSDGDEGDKGDASTHSHHKQIIKAIEYKRAKSKEAIQDLWQKEHIVSFFKLFEVNSAILSKLSEHSITGEYMDMIGAPTLAMYGMSHPHEIQAVLKAWRRIRMNRLSPSDLFSEENIDQRRRRIAQLERELLEAETDKEKVQSMYVELAERMEGVDLSYQHKLNMQAVTYSTQQNALELQIKKLLSPTEEEQSLAKREKTVQQVHAAHSKDISAHVLTQGFARAHSKHLQDRYDQIVGEVHEKYAQEMEIRQLRHQQDLSTHRSIIEGHKASLQDHKRTIRRHAQTIADHTKQIETHKGEIADHKTMLNTHKDTIGEREKSIEEKEAMIVSQKEKEEELARHIAEVKAAKQEVHHNHDQLVEDLAKYKDIHENHKVSKEMEIAMAHTVIEEARAQVALLESEIKRLVVVERDLSEIHTTQEKEIASLKEESIALKEMNVQWKERVEQYVSTVRETVSDVEYWKNQVQQQQERSVGRSNSIAKSGESGGNGDHSHGYGSASNGSNGSNGSGNRGNSNHTPLHNGDTAVAIQHLSESVSKLTSQEELLLGSLGTLGTPGLEGNSTELAMIRGHQSALKAGADEGGEQGGGDTSHRDYNTRREVESDKFEFLAHEDIPLELEARLKKSKVHETYFKKLREENSSLRMKVARLEREKRDSVVEGAYHSQKTYPHSSSGREKNGTSTSNGGNGSKQNRSPQRQKSRERDDREGDISASDASHIASMNTQRPVSMQAPRANPTDGTRENGEREDGTESPRRRNSWHSLNANSLISAGSEAQPGAGVGAIQQEEDDDNYYYPNNNDGYGNEGDDGNYGDMDGEDEREGIQVGFQESKLDYSEVYPGGSYQPQPYQDLDELVRYDTGLVVGMPDQSLDTIYSDSPGVVYNTSGNGNNGNGNSTGSTGGLLMQPYPGSQEGEMYSSTDIIDNNMNGSNMRTEDILLTYRIRLANAAKRIATLESERSILITRLHDAQEVIVELTDTQMKMLKKIASEGTDHGGVSVGDMSPRWNDGHSAAYSAREGGGRREKRKSRSPPPRGGGISAYSRGYSKGSNSNANGSGSRPQAPATSPPQYRGAAGGYGTSHTGGRSVGRGKSEKKARFNDVKWDDSTTSRDARVDRAWIPASKPGRTVRVYETPSAPSAPRGGAFHERYEGATMSYDPTSNNNGNGNNNNNNNSNGNNNNNNSSNGNNGDNGEGNESEDRGPCFPEHSVNDQGVPVILVSPRLPGGSPGSTVSTGAGDAPKIKSFRGFAAPQMHHIPRMHNLRKSSMFPTDQRPPLGFVTFNNVPRTSNTKSQ